MDQHEDLKAAPLREAMDSTRRSIQGTVGELRDRVGEAMDWRSYIQRYPMASLALAAGAGMYLGRRLGNLAELPSDESSIVPRSISQAASQVMPASARLNESWARAGARLEAIVNRMIDEAGDTVEKVLVPTLISGFARLLGGGDARPLEHAKRATYTDQPSATAGTSANRAGAAP